MVFRVLILSLSTLVFASQVALAQSITCPAKPKSRKLIEQLIAGKITQSLGNTLTKPKVKVKVTIKSVDKTSKAATPDLFGMNVNSTYAAGQAGASGTLSVSITETAPQNVTCSVTASAKIKLSGSTSGTDSKKVKVESSVENFTFKIPLTEGKVSKKAAASS